MDINGNISKGLKLQSGFRWPKDGIKYLGIYIPPSLQNLYEANYSKIIWRIDSDLKQWSTLPLSLLGCVESIRMNVLPGLLYLFQMLPIEIPKQVFDNLHKSTSKFIWHKKRPRIRLKTLQLSKLNGGLGLPNLKYYFWAAQMKPLVAWIKNNTNSRWLNIEKGCSTLRKGSEHELSFTFFRCAHKQLAEWTKNTLKIWSKIQSAFGLPKSISLLTSIGSIKTFAPNKVVRYGTDLPPPAIY